MWALPQAPATWAAFAYLTVFGTLVLFYLQLFVLNRWTATTTSYALLLLPLVTVLVSSWLTGEVVTLQFVIGASIVLLGVWIGALSRSRIPTPSLDETLVLQISEAGCQD